MSNILANIRQQQTSCECINIILDINIMFGNISTLEKVSSI